MLLDGKYFNKLELNLVRDKYYSAEDVDNILLDIRKKAEAQAKEYREMQSKVREADKLKEKLAEFESQRNEISDAVVAARNAYKTIMDKAAKQAETLLADSEAKAQEKADRIIGEAEAKANEEREARIRAQEYYVSKFEQMYSKLRQRYTDAIDELNNEWQDFLVNLTDESEDKDIEVEIFEEPKNGK